MEILAFVIFILLVIFAINEPGYAIIILLVLFCIYADETIEFLSDPIKNIEAILYEIDETSK